MNNEEILKNAPKWATMFYMKRYWQKLTTKTWRSIRLDGTCDTLKLIPNANSGNIRSLSDIRRIVELEKEVDRLRAQFKQADEAHTKLESMWFDERQRAESSEKRLAEVDAELTVTKTLLSNLWPENYKPMDGLVKEIAEALRKQLNRGEL